MSDPLSVIASVAAVSTAALQSAQVLLQLIDGVKNAPEEIAAVSNDTHAFYDIVFSLETSFKDDDVVSVVRENVIMVAMVANIEKPLRNCSTTLGQIMLKIQGQVRVVSDGKGSMFRSGAKWYFRKKDIKESLDRLGQNKATLNAALNTISAFCHLRLMATTGREPDDWSSVFNECGSMGTDVGFALNRFIQGTVTLPFPGPPPLTSDIEAQCEDRSEDPAPELISRMHSGEVSRQENRAAISQDATSKKSSALLNATMRVHFLQLKRHFPSRQVLKLSIIIDR